MKKFSITILLISVLIACNSEKEQLFDDLLSGTIWEYRQIDVTPTDDNFEESFADNFSEMLELFPDIKYSIGDINDTQKNDTVYNQGLYNIATLKFEKGNCFYKEECYQEITIEQYNVSYQKYKFEVGEYNNDYIGILKIAKDGIYLNRFGNEEKIYTLDNFQLMRFIGKTLLGKKNGKAYSWQNELSLKYQRADEQIIFINDSVKWSGIIDFSQYTIDVTQILPSGKPIHVFKLQ